MIPKPDILKLYEQGLSTRQIAAQTGYGKSTIHRICKGHCRSRSEAIRLAKPLKATTHWRTCRAQARKIWIRIHGPIPPGHHIHHKDGDFTNNEIANLECVDMVKHAYIHHPQNPVPRHLRPNRKAYMKSYLHEYWKTYKRSDDTET